RTRWGAAAASAVQISARRWGQRLLRRTGRSSWGTWTPRSPRSSSSSSSTRYRPAPALCVPGKGAAGRPRPPWPAGLRRPPRDSVRRGARAWWRPLRPGLDLTLRPRCQAGPVITVKIPKDRDGRPKQFAFVNFKHEESVPYGLRLLNGIRLYGRPMRIQFRSGSSHAAQDINPSCSQLGAAGTSPPGMPHPASNCSRYERVPDGMASPGFQSSLQRQAVVCAHTHRHRLWEYTFGVLK
ncbi:hypothetical protein Nmel_017246, partial [Mimus melanotis]